MNERFSYFRTQAGYDDLPKIPEQTRVVYAYKGGEAKAFTTVTEAKTFSSVTETVYLSSEERDRIIEMHAAVERQAFSDWFSALRNYWSVLSDEVFKVCYAQAYADGHSSGYDEVNNEMYDVADFAAAIMKAAKKDNDNSVVFNTL